MSGLTVSALHTAQTAAERGVPPSPAARLPPAHFLNATDVQPSAAAHAAPQPISAAAKPPPQLTSVATKPPARPTVRDTNWLLVLSTGRAGSTTILDMLNSVPGIMLSGELSFAGKGTVLGHLWQAYDLVASLSRSSSVRAGGPWQMAPETAKLRENICGWLRSLVPEGSTRYYGFKELVGVPGHVDVPRALSLFGSHVRVVRTYRLDLAWCNDHPRSMSPRCHDQEHGVVIARDGMVTAVFLLVVAVRRRRASSASTRANGASSTCARATRS